VAGAEVDLTDDKGETALTKALKAVLRARRNKQRFVRFSISIIRYDILSLISVCIVSLYE
jgi:hypothetical protein